MKKVVMFGLLAVTLMTVVGLTGCGGGGDKYADVKAIINDTIKLQDDFIAGINGAKSAKDIVTAIDAFGAGMKDLQPKAMAIDAKHPELKDESKIPADIQAMVKKAEGTSEKLGEAMTKVTTKYAGDKSVQDALMKFAKAMQALQ